MAGVTRNRRQGLGGLTALVLALVALGLVLGFSWSGWTQRQAVHGELVPTDGSAAVADNGGFAPRLARSLGREPGRIVVPATEQSPAMAWLGVAALVLAVEFLAVGMALESGTSGRGRLQVVPSAPAAREPSHRGRKAA